MENLRFIIEQLQAGLPVPASFNPHPLQAEWDGFMECHLDADWLLIWRDLPHVVELHRTGRQRQLFKGKLKKA